MGPRESTNVSPASLQEKFTLQRSFLWKWGHQGAGALERNGNRVPSFAFVLVVAFLLVLAVACSRGGYAHQEIEQYIPHYLSHRPLLNKIFDYKKVEVWLSYRPRPISYIVDDLDVAFIGWSSRQGFPHLLSASYYVFWALDCFLLWFYLCHRLGLHRLTAGLFICLFSTDSVVFFHTGYFRSAKPGGTFLLLSAFVVFSECVRAALDRRSGLRSGLLACLGAALLFCACLFDEIPAAFALAGAVMLAIEFLWNRNSPRARAFLYPLVAIVAVLLAFTYYDVVVHRWLIWVIDGERVSMSYQSGTASALLWHPAILLVGTISVFVDVLGRLAGDLPSVLAFLLMLALISIWSPVPQERQAAYGVRQFLRANDSRAVIRILVGGFLMAGCLYGMIARHHPVMRTDVRVSEYVLPLTTVFLLFFSVTASMVVQKRYLSRGALQLMLVILVASNLVFVVSQRVFSHGDPFTEILLQTLRNSPIPASERMNTPGFARLQSEALQSPIYKTLHAEMTGQR
jgi:hypothetical protein